MYPSTCRKLIPRNDGIPFREPPFCGWIWLLKSSSLQSLQLRFCFNPHLVKHIPDKINLINFDVF